jgi:hypothetical protein
MKVQGEAMKPIWKTAPFTKIEPVQVYGGAPPCENLPVCGNRAAVMLQTKDHRAIDLCMSCAEQAFADGAFKNRFALDNHAILMKKPKGAPYTDPWLANSSSWHKLPAEFCKDGIRYQGE